VWAVHAPEAEPHFLPVDAGCFPFEDGSFDLVWNFNVMPRQAAPLELLREMARVSRGWVLVFVPNRANYGFWLHRLHHRVARQAWDHGSVGLMSPAGWQRLFSLAGLQVREIAWVDCPPWPDIVDPGQLIADFFPFLKGPARRARPENRMRWEAAELPYYDPHAYAPVHRRMERLAVFEKTPWRWLKQRVAHHIGILGWKVGR
jgi:SAM-dependent methyltransferase